MISVSILQDLYNGNTNNTMGYSKDPFGMNRRSRKASKEMLNVGFGIVSAISKASKTSNRNRRKSRGPTDSELINQNPSQFCILFISLFLAVVIPLEGGPWWLLFAIPTIGLVVLLISESWKSKHQRKKTEKNEATTINLNEKRDLNLDKILQRDIEKGHPLRAIQYYKLIKGVNLEDAKKHIDDLTSQLKLKQK